MGNEPGCFYSAALFSVFSGLLGLLTYMDYRLIKTESEIRNIKTGDVNNNGLIDTYVEIDGKKYFSVFDGKNLEGLVDKKKVEKD